MAGLFVLLGLWSETGEIRIGFVEPPTHARTICAEITPIEGGVRPPTACGTIEARRATIDVPAGRWDLRLVLEGHAPVYFWDLAIDEGEVVDLGPIRPIPGASVAGWIAGVDLDAEDGAKIEMVLRPKVFGWLGDPEQRRKVDRVESTTIPRADGFFQLTGADAGPHELLVRFEEGIVERLLEIDLERGEAVAFDSPFVVERPEPVLVYVDPPVDGAGEPWTVELRRQIPRTTILEPVDHGVTENGAWTSRPLPPGLYELELADSSGSEWWSRAVDVETSSLVEIALDLRRVRGELTLGGEPMAGEIVFGTMNRRPRIGLRSDDEGRFEGALPRAGEWEVEVAVGGDFFAVEPIEIDPDDDPAEITIELPDTTLTGTVTRAGRPVPGAIVIVRRADDRQQIATARTDADGAFRLRGLPEGDVATSALDGRETSDWAFVRLHDGDEASDVRLEIASRRVVRGLLRHRGAPVVGAEIDYRVGDPTFLAHPARATTDLEGRFELSVPLGTTRVGVLVTTPSPAIHVGRLDWSFASLDTAGPVELAPWDLPETLALRLPIDRSILEGADSRWVLVDGVPIEASILTNLGLRLGTLSTRDDAFWIDGLGLADYQVCESRRGPCRPAHTRIGGAPVGEPVVAGSLID